MNSGIPEPQYDPEFTNRVITATGPKAHPRLKQLMPSLLQHLHDFAREVNLTTAEWRAGVDLVSTYATTNKPTFPPDDPVSVVWIDLI